MSECATPPDDLMRLADAITNARDEYLNAYMNEEPSASAKRRDLERLLWNDKGTFGPALHLAAEAGRLRKGIQDYLDGDFGPKFTSKLDKCPHGKFGWEDCGNCVDEYFSAVLTPPSPIEKAQP